MEKTEKLVAVLAAINHAATIRAENDAAQRAFEIARKRLTETRTKLADTERQLDQRLFQLTYDA